MKQGPSIHPEAIAKISSRWIQAIKAQENILSVFPRGVAGYRRLESLISDQELLKNNSINVEKFAFYYYRVEPTSPDFITTLQNLFQIKKKIENIDQCIQEINKKYTQNQQHIFLIAFIDSWLNKETTILHLLSLVSDSCPQIQFLLLTEENIHDTEKIILLGKYHQLFQNISYIPLYSNETLQYFVTDYSTILEKPISKDQALKLLQVTGKHIALVKEAVRLHCLYDVPFQEITQQLSYKIKLSQIWSSFSRKEQTVFNKIWNNQVLETQTLKETYIHLRDLQWFEETPEKILCSVPGFEYFITQKTPVKLLLQLGHLYIGDTIADDKFTQNEAKLLTLFLSGTKNLYTKEELFERLWDNPEEYSDWALDKSLHRLRTKLNELQVTSQIVTLRGRGYSWQA